jgi:hypothetical protein
LGEAEPFDEMTVFLDRWFDATGSANHNGDVFRAVLRLTAGIVVLPFWLFASAVVPLHAHEGDADHSHVVVHSHFAPHHSIAHQPEESEVEAGEHIVWLDASIIDGATFHLDTPAVGLTRVKQPLPAYRWWPTFTFDDGAPAHGPPRFVIALRAPPVLPV